MFQKENSLIFPEINTPRLVLAELEASDAAAVFNLFSNNNVVEYYDLEAFSSIEQAQNLIRLFQSRYVASSGIRWAIRLKKTGALIGTCGFNSWSQPMKSAVIGYDLLPECWGSGYATEAVYAAIRAAFSGDLVCGALHRVQADTVPGNSASEALLRRLGFKEEGLRRESGYWKGAFHDLKCFGLLQPEFTPLVTNIAVGEG